MGTRIIDDEADQKLQEFTRAATYVSVTSLYGFYGSKENPDRIILQVVGDDKELINSLVQAAREHLEAKRLSNFRLYDSYIDCNR